MNYFTLIVNSISSIEVWGGIANRNYLNITYDFSNNPYQSTVLRILRRLIIIELHKLILIFVIHI